MLTDATARVLRPIVVALVVVTTLSGCGALYVAQAARGQFQVLRQRQPIERVIADARTPDPLRSRLTRVRRMRDFASTELGLPQNRSYRTYADVGRPYVVWNVVATPEFSVQPQRWCFPVVGCVAYRGYFQERRARDFALGLRTRGFDTQVGGVAAYSTLGRFADPVLNTMLGYGDDELAAIVFHELSHQLLYVKDDSEFNEAFAVAVEEAGLARWLAAEGRAADLDRFRLRRARQTKFVALFSRARADLARLYAQPLPDIEKRARKRERLAVLAKDIASLDRQLGVKSVYGAWAEAGLNNAHLASVATYYDCVPGFERLLAREGNDLQKFYAAVRELARRPATERRRAVCT